MQRIISPKNNNHTERFQDSTKSKLDRDTVLRSTVGRVVAWDRGPLVVELEAAGPVVVAVAVAES